MYLFLCCLPLHCKSRVRQSPQQLYGTKRLKYFRLVEKAFYWKSMLTSNRTDWKKAGKKWTLFERLKRFHKEHPLLILLPSCHYLPMTWGISTGSPSGAILGFKPSEAGVLWHVSQECTWDTTGKLLQPIFRTSAHPHRWPQRSKNCQSELTHRFHHSKTQAKKKVQNSPDNSGKCPN